MAAAQQLQLIKEFLEYMGSKLEYDYVSDVSALDDRLNLASLGFVQAIETIYARKALGDMKNMGILPEAPPNDAWGLQAGFPSVSILGQRFNIKYGELWDNPLLPRWGFHKGLLLAQILRVVESKQTLEELEALQTMQTVQKEIQIAGTPESRPMIIGITDPNASLAGPGRRGEVAHALGKIDPNATIRDQRLTAAVNAWIPRSKDEAVPPPGWFTVPWSAHYNDEEINSHPWECMGHIGGLPKGTLVLSVDDGWSTCAAENWPDGKSLPLWSRLLLPGEPPERIFVSAEEVKDDSLIDLLNRLQGKSADSAALVQKLMQWRRNRLRVPQAGMAVLEAALS